VPSSVCVSVEAVKVRRLQHVFFSRTIEGDGSSTTLAVGGDAESAWLVRSTPRSSLAIETHIINFQPVLVWMGYKELPSFIQVKEHTFGPRVLRWTIQWLSKTIEIGVHCSRRIGRCCD
jgi:hypothetical protein